MAEHEGSLSKIPPAEYKKRQFVADLEDFFLKRYYRLMLQATGDETYLVKSVAVEHLKDGKGRKMNEITIDRDPSAQYAFELTLSTETVGHAMPHYVARRVLSQIPNPEIEDKNVLDLFGGHGAISFLLFSGWKGVMPKRMITSDLAYSRHDDSYIHIYNDWADWNHHLRRDWYERPQPQFLKSRSDAIPLAAESIDTVFADPPFGHRTSIDGSPVDLFNDTLPEMARVLAPGGNAYCLFPNQFMNRLKLPNDLTFSLLSENVGKTDIDIAFLKLRKTA